MAGPGARKARQRRQVGQPPVMSRQAAGGSPTVRRTGSTPRRRYDIALNVPGAEIRLPSVPQVRVGWRLVSGLVVLAMLAALYGMFFTPMFKVESVEIIGAQRLTSEDINQALGLYGELIFAINPAQVQERLEAAFPELASFELAVGLPRTIALSVVERTPVVAWVQDGQETWMDTEGIGFPPRGEVQGLLYVQASGLPMGADQEGGYESLVLKPELVESMLAMQAYLPEGGQLLFDAGRGFGWDDGRGWRVFFGQEISEINQKLSTYQTLVETLGARGITPALISVEYLQAPYYRTEP
jgi:cell division protein FtsQ